MPKASRLKWRRDGGPRAQTVLAFALGSVSYACEGGGAGQGVEDGASEPWAVVEDLRIGSVEGRRETMFGAVGGVHPSSDGGLWVFDSQFDELRFFDGHGEFERLVGRSGQGPGEFASSGFMSPCARAGPDGEIWVEDALRRWQRFDGRGNLLGQVRVTRTVHCGGAIWTPDGRFFMTTTQFDEDTGERTGRFLVQEMADTGELSTVDTVPYPILPTTPSVAWVNPAGTVRSVQPIPFVHRSMWILGPEGDFWITEGDGQYLVRRQGVKGDTVLVFRREYSPVPIPPQLRRDAIDAFRQEGRIAEGGFDSSQVPEVYPPFDSYFVGTDGALWVRRTSEDGVGALDLFGNDGRYRGEVTVPIGFDRMSIWHATDQFLFGVWRDGLGLAYPIRLRIVPPR